MTDLASVSEKVSKREGQHLAINARVYKKRRKKVTLAI